jgi:hypothetical protein
MMQSKPDDSPRTIAAQAVNAEVLRRTTTPGAESRSRRTIASAQTALDWPALALGGVASTAADAWSLAVPANALPIPRS